MLLPFFLLFLCTEQDAIEKQEQEAEGIWTQGAAGHVVRDEVN